MSASIQDTTQERLSKRLQTFGLNPNDWRLQRSYKSFFKITHRNNPDIVLLGRAKVQQHSCEWLELSLKPSKIFSGIGGSPEKAG